MSLATCYSRALLGVESPSVTIEVHMANGLPALSIVGLAEMAVKESKDRVRGAMLTCGYEFPPRRITVNLAPADLPKEGARLDLPIAIGILAASGQIPTEELASYEFIGELALSGDLRAVKGVLPIAMAARSSGRTLVLPHENAAEAALVEGLNLLPVESLLQLNAHLTGQALIPPFIANHHSGRRQSYEDIRDVRGQSQAKRALTIAAAGGHSLLMIGPPGTGKTMLARRLPGLLPEMHHNDALESAALLSISDQGFDPQQWRQRLFRAPHHTASAVALVGGGSPPRPGEISLAHHGVLFLDELPEFDRRVLEVLREPMEAGHITISRAARQADFPACFQLIAAMNPCPCGYLGHPNGRCHCTPAQIHRYRSKISGPLLDRIDMHVEVPVVALERLQQAQEGEDSAQIRQRVASAREFQQQRQGEINAALNNAAIDKHCQLDSADQALLSQAMEKLQLSARAYHRILKVARTIADIDGSDMIRSIHLGEAINYRRLERGQ